MYGHRYILFGYMNYYPQGGLKDILESSDNLEKLSNSIIEERSPISDGYKWNSEKGKWFKQNYLKGTEEYDVEVYEGDIEWCWSHKNTTGYIDYWHILDTKLMQIVCWGSNPFYDHSMHYNHDALWHENIKFDD